VSGYPLSHLNDFLEMTKTSGFPVSTSLPTKSIWLFY